jgi:transcriptional regulator with XRE-family HTH domain
MEVQNVTSSRLRDERLRQELTQREVGYFAFCSHATIARLEAGTLDVSPALKARIARVLRVSVAELWPAGPAP